MRFSKEMEEAMRQAEDKLTQSLEEDEKEIKRLREAIWKILTRQPLDDYARKVCRIIEEGTSGTEPMDRNAPDYLEGVKERCEAILDLAYPLED